uniref:Uncharacterized protein n=1 Tax=Brassica oleracea var. oleracea TaxID=109376 RepID=A0A0D3BXI3_BRAOL
MAHQLPKRILQEGADTQIDKINNTCRRTLLNAVKVALKDEYEEILKDPVFGPLLAIIENNLIYSGKIIHSFMCKQLRVSKLHELWFLFAKRPLSTGPPAAKGKGKASANVDPPPVRRSPRPNLTKSSRCVDKGTKDTLQEAMENFSQASHVKGFDPSQHLDGDEPADFATPLSSFKPADWRPPTLKDVDSHEDRIHDPDYSLVFVPEELWAKLVDWTKTFK